MADYVPQWTARYRLTYSVQGHEHDMIFRWARGAPIVVADMVAKVKAFLDQTASVRWTDWTALRAALAVQDSVVFNPTTLPAPNAGTAAITTRATSAAAFYWQFQGRSQAGGRASYYLYGVSGAAAIAVGGDVASDFRLTSAESAVVLNAYSALNTGNPTLAANDGFGLLFYNYVNTKYNDNWLHKIRT